MRGCGNEARIEWEHYGHFIEQLRQHKLTFGRRIRQLIVKSVKYKAFVSNNF